MKLLTASPLVTGVLALLITGYDVINVSSKADELEREAGGFATVGAGTGLYLALVGAILTVVAGIVRRRDTRAAATTNAASAA